MNGWRFCVAGVCLAIGNVFGQPEGGVPSAAPEAVGPLPGEQVVMTTADLLQEGDRLIQAGETNAALERWMSAHGQSLNDHANLAARVAAALVAAGREQDADNLCRENLAQSDRLLRDYVNQAHQEYARREDPRALAAWAGGLLGQSLPPDLRVEVFGWLADATRQAGPFERVLELVPLCAASFDGATSRALLAKLVAGYEAAGDAASVDKLLEALDRVAGRHRELGLLAATLRVNRLFDAGRWPEAEARFLQEAPGLPDAELWDCFRHAKPLVLKAGQSELWDHLCLAVLQTQPGKSRTWAAAAMAWLETAKNGQPEDLPARLDQLVQLDGDPAIMAGLFCLFSDPIMKAGRPESLRAMTKTGGKLAAKLKDKNKRDLDLCKCKIAEYYFLLEDYDSTLRLFKEPLASLEPAEQENIVNKIKAHQAMQQGRCQDAIGYLRAFMENVKTWTEPENSIFLDIVFSKEMCLGLSAKRIGDMHAKLNEAGKARAAYQEADGYYAAAEKEFQNKAKESEYIRKCRTELAGLIKK